MLHLGPDERALCAAPARRAARAADRPDGDPATCARLFPVVHPDDADQEAEYQRLMRDELVTSRLAGIDVVEAVLGGPGAR